MERPYTTYVSNAPTDFLFDTGAAVLADSPQAAGKEPREGKIKHIVLNRQQLCWAAIDLEHLIGADHPARAIGDILKGMDVSRFEQEILTREQQV